MTTYDPKDDTWREAPSRCGPAPRNKPLVVWAGDGIIVWGGVADCSTASDPSACEETESQRAFYLPASALFDGVEDPPDCTCASARMR